MGFIDRFLSDPEPKALSPLEKITLSYEMIAQVGNEMFGKRYRPQITEEYFPEERLVRWIDTISQTPVYGFFKRYFGVKIEGEENIPSETGALLVANHSTIFFGDLAPIYVGIYEKKRRWPYGLAFTMFGNSDIVKTIGGVKGKRDMGIRILEGDKLALACPGGILDACKPFYHRYEVRPVGGFAPEHCGYVKTAWAARKPIIPVATVGGEETILILGDMKPFVTKVMSFLDEAVALKSKPWFDRLYGLVDFAKIVPLPLNLFPFKSNVTAYVGAPIDVRDLLGSHPAQDDFSLMNNVVMARLQRLINEGLRKRG